MTERSTHRLAGLEPDNLLAFLALLGALRSLERVRPAWRPRVGWTVDAPPVRPTLTVAAQTTEAEMVAAVAEGLADLASRHDFRRLKDLKLSPDEAAERLRTALSGDRYAADLWAALTSDGAIRDRNKAREAEPTPLCLLFGQGHMHFMSRLASVPQESTPPARGAGRRKTVVGESDCLHEALFEPWTRPDATFSFRWDPHEDVRYALRATDPTDSKTKETTQHGANRLAAIGLSALTVAPRLRGATLNDGISLWSTRRPTVSRMRSTSWCTTVIWKSATTATASSPDCSRTGGRHAIAIIMLPSHHLVQPNGGRPDERIVRAPDS